MRVRILTVFCFMMLSVPALGMAQEAAIAPTEDVKPTATLQERLIPESTVKLLAPAEATINAEDNEPAQPALPRGSGTGLIIAGGALFVAGLIVGGDAGTLMAVTGAAIGAYGLYLYF